MLIGGDVQSFALRVREYQGEKGKFSGVGGAVKVERGR